MKNLNIEDEVIYNMYLEIFNKKFNDESYSINANISES